MSQEQLAQLIHEHTATIAALERRISTHEAIRLILAQRAEQTLDPEQQGLYQQAIADLRQMQADEHEPRKTGEPGTDGCRAD